MHRRDELSLNDRHREIDDALQLAKRAIDRGEVEPMESLPEFLKFVRIARPGRKASQ
jgi:hypothetical protein